MLIDPIKKVSTPTALANQATAAGPSAFTAEKLGFNKPIAAGPSRFPSLITQTTAPQTANTTPATTQNLNPDLTKLGAKTTDWGGSTRFEKFHPGIDIANKIGTPIPATVQGTVTAVDTGHKQGDKAYGNTITVTDPWGNKHRYSHLSQVFVKVGQKVGKGQEVATMGNTGQTYSTSGGTGSHLDYRIVDAYNKYVNPYTYLKKFT
jgi:murein DD-endopeptidase MepM/ murein hydrolase activator NlpD